MGGKEQEKNHWKALSSSWLVWQVCPESGGENLYFMGNFYTLKFLARVLMGCNNEPVLYEVSANILELATVRE